MRHLRRADDPDKVDWGKAAYLLALALITIGMVRDCERKWEKYEE